MMSVLGVFVPGPGARSSRAPEEAGGVGEESRGAGPSGERATDPRSSRSVALSGFRSDHQHFINLNGHYSLKQISRCVTTVIA